MKTILAPIDFSAATRRVVAAAAALSRAVGGRLVLLNVTNRPLVVIDDQWSGKIIADLTLLAEKSAAQQLARLQKKLRTGGITAITRHRSGSPIPGIVAAAKELKADYIVLGSHGHGAFHDLIAGSTTGGVLKKAPCAVVVIPIPAARKRRRQP
jgi:nucleotide-binding universal stress UspA family protein